MTGPRNPLALYPIGVAKRLTGFSERQIRYYESLGLLKPARSEGGQRLFAPADLERLQLIKRLSEQGMGLRAIRSYLDLQRSRQKEPEVPGENELAESGDFRARFANPNPGVSRATPSRAPAPGGPGSVFRREAPEN